MPPRPMLRSSFFTNARFLIHRRRNSIAHGSIHSLERVSPFVSHEGFASSTKISLATRLTRQHAMNPQFFEDHEHSEYNKSFLRRPSWR